MDKKNADERIFLQKIKSSKGINALNSRCQMPDVIKNKKKLNQK